MRLYPILNALNLHSLALATSLAKRWWLGLFFILSLAFLSYVPSQTGLPTIDRTEAVFAIATRYVITEGAYLEPVYNEKLQRTRPIGTFWAQGLATLGADETALNKIETYRLPSLIVTLIAVALMWWFSAQLLPPTAALLATISVAITPIVVLHASLSIAEPYVLPTIILAQFSLMALYLNKDPPIVHVVLFWAALGISTWFNALAVPLLGLVTVLSLCLWDRDFTLMRQLRPWFGLPVMMLLATPWLIAVAAMDDGHLYRGMSWGSILAALEGAQSMNFKTIPGVFILMLMLGFVPVQHMLGPAIGSFWSSRDERTIRFLLVWLIAPIVALELLSNKPPLYTIQAVFPAGAALVALAAVPGTDWHRHSLRAWPGTTWGVIAFCILLGGAFLGYVLYVTATPFSFGYAAGLVLIWFLATIAAHAAARAYMMAWFTLALGTTLALNMWFNGYAIQNLRNFWTTPPIVKAHTALQSCAPGPVHIVGFREPSLVLALGKQATLGSADTAANAIAATGAAYAIVESRHERRFRQQLGSQDIQVDELGCIRSFNIARGCALKFQVYRRSSTASGKPCKLDLPRACPPIRHFKGTKAAIKHCG